MLAKHFGSMTDPTILLVCVLQGGRRSLRMAEPLVAAEAGAARQHGELTSPPPLSIDAVAKVEKNM